MDAHSRFKKFIVYFGKMPRGRGNNNKGKDSQNTKTSGERHKRKLENENTEIVKEKIQEKVCEQNRDFIYFNTKE